VEEHEATQNTFADQEMQVEMAGPYKLRKPPDVIARQALEWNPQGKRGRPRNTWRRTVLKEAIRLGRTLKLMPRME